MGGLNPLFSKDLISLAINITLQRYTRRSEEAELWDLNLNLVQAISPLERDRRERRDLVDFYALLGVKRTDDEIYYWSYCQYSTVQYSFSGEPF